MTDAVGTYRGGWLACAACDWTADTQPGTPMFTLLIEHLATEHPPETREPLPEDLSPAGWLEARYDQAEAEYGAHGTDRDAHLRTELADEGTDQ